MRLAELQRAIQGFVLHGDTAAEQLVRGSEHFDVRTRLQVYEHAFPERLAGALKVTYPAVHGVLGEATFRALTRAFVKRFPPHHFSIRYFGAELDAFIAEEFSGRKATVLSELARWEWTLAAAFDAADAEPVNAAALASIDPALWAELRFELAPSLHRLHLGSNAVQWWRFATQGATRPTRWRIAQVKHWAAWRSSLATFFRSLHTDEARALEAAAAGQSLQTICEGLSETHGIDAAARAATLLQGWLRDGWIVGVRRS